MNRNNLILLISLLSLCLTACKREAASAQPQPPGTIFILLDASASVDGRTRAEYLRYLNRIVMPRLQPGEKIVMSPVGDRETINEPVRLLDMDLPGLPKQPGDGMKDNPAQEAKLCLASFTNARTAFETGRKELAQGIKRGFESAPHTARTYLLDGFEMAGRTLAELPRPWTLIVLSDGLEDSAEGPAIVFNQPDYWRPSRIPTLLQSLKEQNRLPNLSNSAVYFIGASAPSPLIARNVRKFWNAYLAESGVSSSQLHYGARPPFRPDTPDLSTLDRNRYCHTIRD